jgi:hypothetical protein
MLTSLMTGDLVAAEDERLALRMRRASRDRRRTAVTTRVRRAWPRTATQPVRP